MFLKFRYRLAYEGLRVVVPGGADSITWRRFCLIALDGAVRHPTKLMKLTTRCGPVRQHRGRRIERGVAGQGGRGEGGAHQPGPRRHHPVRHLTVLRNVRRCSICWRAAPGLLLPGNDDVPHAQVIQRLIDSGFPVPAVGGHGPRCPCEGRISTLKPGCGWGPHPPGQPRRSQNLDRTGGLHPQPGQDRRPDRLRPAIGARSTNISADDPTNLRALNTATRDSQVEVVSGDFRAAGGQPPALKSALVKNVFECVVAVPGIESDWTD